MQVVAAAPQAPNSNVHWLRVAIGLQARIPTAIWLVLYALVIIGMIEVGYQTASAARTVVAIATSMLHCSPTLPDMMNRRLFSISFGMRSSTRYIAHASKTAASAIIAGANQKFTRRRSQVYRAVTLRMASSSCDTSFANRLTRLPAAGF